MEEQAGLDGCDGVKERRGRAGAPSWSAMSDAVRLERCWRWRAVLHPVLARSAALADAEHLRSGGGRWRAVSNLAPGGVDL